MKSILCAFIVVLTVISCTAQKGPLKGSGKVVSQSFSLSNFDKLSLMDLDGRIEVEIGKPFSVSVSIDDNLQPLLDVSVNDGILSVGLKGNRENKLYIEETNIVVKISMPEASVIEHRGNSTLSVIGIIGRYFRLENSGNGGATLRGSIDELDLICRSNGTIHAEQLIAKNAKASAKGNGNVYINTANLFSASVSGNGNIVNKGKGKADASSSATGNGRISSAHK